MNDVITNTASVTFDTEGTTAINSVSVCVEVSRCELQQASNHLEKIASSHR
ncbi:MAG TPA: hypothetical protein VJ998_02990 [Pseudomonadales bacterium]|nr:hypothetical protein [Pseudomonadales bacterium]